MMMAHVKCKMYCMCAYIHTYTFGELFVILVDLQIEKKNRNNNNTYVCMTKNKWNVGHTSREYSVAETIPIVAILTSLLYFITTFFC